MRPGTTKPILALRRAETAALCAAAGLTPVQDPSNLDPAHRRNRVRHELLPLLEDIAQRDVVPVLTRQADLLRDEADLLDELAAPLDAAAAPALAAAPPALARRAVRRLLSNHADGDAHPPSAASVERVLAVARNEAAACELEGGVRVRRSRGRLHVALASEAKPPRRT
jgi:tRNA(Ile)-lysidine synthase